MKLRNKIFSTIGLGCLIALTSSNVNALLYTPNSNTVNLAQTTTQDIAPTEDYEKVLSNQTLIDQNNKNIFVNTLDDKTNSDLFFNNLNYLTQLKETTAQLSSGSYNLDENEVKQLSLQLNQCNYRNSNTCIKAVQRNATELSQSKQQWNHILMFICEVIIGLNLLLIFYKIVLLLIAKIKYGKKHEN